VFSVQVDAVDGVEKAAGVVVHCVHFVYLGLLSLNPDS
jgi:hypothetical protein